jgi:hypothetical protein
MCGFALPAMARSIQVVAPATADTSAEVPYRQTCVQDTRGRLRVWGDAATFDDASAVFEDALDHARSRLD